MGKKWWEYIYIYIYIVGGCSFGGKMSMWEEGEPNCKNRYQVFTGWD
jgi:hypothetical protein